MGPRFREDDGGVFVAHLAKISKFKLQTAKHLRSRAAARVELFNLSPLDFEGRWSAEKRALVVNKSAFRTLHRGICG
jgi:hypothetical protein